MKRRKVVSLEKSETTGASWQTLVSSILMVTRWVESCAYRGYDPGDGLNSFLRYLTFGNQLAQRILIQVVWKAPVNLRPLVGIRRQESTKGRGYMAWGYLLMYRITGETAWREKAIACLDWLEVNASRQKGGYAWGNHFDFVTRGGCNPAGSPIIVWTALIGEAFVTAYEVLGDDHYLGIARGISHWISQLPREQTDSGVCLSYVPFGQSSIHNANMLGAAMLARTWQYIQDPELLDLARSCVLYTCSRQRADGSWWYAEQPKYHWIDSFHTGYILDSLWRYQIATRELQWEQYLTRGLRYYRETFFEPSGRPRYYHNRTYPIDIQCAAQGIDTLALTGSGNADALNLAMKVARWTIENMQDQEGFFYYRKYPLLTARTPYLHWGQATTFKALAQLLTSLSATGIQSGAGAVPEHV